MPGRGAAVQVHPEFIQTAGANAAGAGAGLLSTGRPAGRCSSQQGNGVPPACLVGRWPYMYTSHVRAGRVACNIRRLVQVG